MKIDNNLNVYDDNVDNKTKIMYKCAIVIFAFLLVVSIILTVIFNEVYSSIIGLIIGSVISVFLYNLIEKRINSSYYQDLKKVTKKIHAIHFLVYALSFLSIALIFKDYYSVIGLTLGLLLIKMAIITSARLIKE